MIEFIIQKQFNFWKSCLKGEQVGLSDHFAFDKTGQAFKCRATVNR